MNGAHERLTLVDIGRQQLGLNRTSPAAVWNDSFQ